VDVDAFVTLYSSYGRSAVDVAAPGGTGDFADPTKYMFGRIWTLCTTTPTEGSFPACKAGLPIAQPFGTSLSAAHVSGLAALLVAQLGHGQPARIRERILQSADDLGQPGTDAFYGKGRINIARALGILP
jgi:subtilisin family serine protease